MNGPILVHATNQNPASIYMHFGKVIRHGAFCRFSCHNREVSGSLEVPYVSSVYNDIAAAICHKLSHTVVATVQGKTVSVRCLLGNL